MKEPKIVHVPNTNWSSELAVAIRSVKEDTVLIVDSSAKRELALRAIQRMSPRYNITIEIC